MKFWKSIVCIFFISSGCTDQEPLQNRGPGAGNGYSRVKTSSLIVNSHFLSFLGNVLATKWDEVSSVNIDYANYGAVLPQFADVQWSTHISRQYTNFAYRICQLSLNSDLGRSQKLVFRYLNFTKPPRIQTNEQTAESVNSFISHLTSRLFRRPGTDEEILTIRNQYITHADLATADGASSVDTKEVVTYACTLIASAPQTVMQRW